MFAINVPRGRLNKSRFWIKTAWKYPKLLDKLNFNEQFTLKQAKEIDRLLQRNAQLQKQIAADNERNELTNNPGQRMEISAQVQLANSIKLNKELSEQIDDMNIAHKIQFDMMRSEMEKMKDDLKVASLIDRSLLPEMDAASTNDEKDAIIAELRNELNQLKHNHVHSGMPKSKRPRDDNDVMERNSAYASRTMKKLWSQSMKKLLLSWTKWK